MLYPSRLFSLLLIIILILMGYYSHKESFDFQMSPLKSEVAGPKVIVVEEPRVFENKQYLVVSFLECRDCFRSQIVTTQFPTYEFGDKLAIAGSLTPILRGDQYFSSYYQRKIDSRVSYPKIKKINYELSFFEQAVFDIRHFLIEIRKKLSLNISRLLPEPEAGLLNGILFGERANLSEDFLTDLSRTGTTHIIALSGFNITIVISFLAFLVPRGRRSLSMVLSILGIVIFVLATGLSASVVRAAIMGTMMLWAGFLGRRSDGLNAVLFAAAVMVALNPAILIFDIGFQLSFAAIIGIIFFTPIFAIPFRFLGRPLEVVISATLAAHLLTWPIISLYFGSFSAIAPFSNLLIVPLLPLVMLLGFVAATSALLSLFFAKIIAFLVWILLAYMVQIVKVFSEFSFASMNFKISSVTIIFLYYALLLYCLFLFNLIKRKHVKKYQS